METTVDARRRGLCNPDYHLTNKNIFTQPSEDLVRKDCKSFRLRVGD